MSTKLHFVIPAFSAFFFVPLEQTRAQCPTCTATTFNVNLSSTTDSAWTTSCVRNGDCCTGTNCVRFNVTLNPGSDLLNFIVSNPSPSGSAYYQINCGPQIPIGQSFCVIGMTSVCITYCKPGGDSPIYHIIESRSVRAYDDMTLRTGCTGTFNVVGLVPASIIWTSIYPGPIGAYNSYLSCTTGCTSTNVTPAAGAPPYIDYMVSGSPLSACAGTSRDTVRVYPVPALSVNITPANSIICSGGPGSVTLSANIAGGTPPFTYSWLPGGQTTPSITVNAAGNYSVTVGDGTLCPPVTATVAVTSAPTPPAPVTSSNSPVCTGSSINLTAGNIAGAVYSWTGPNGFSSTQQNPVIPAATLANAGTYSVIATVGSCTGPPGTTSVTVNTTPLSPVASSNSPVCSTASLNLTASTIAGAVYSWTGPNGFTSSLQNPVINNVTTAASGTYSVAVTVSGCTSSFATTTVIVNPTPAAPAVSCNSPICAGSTLNLTASAVAGSSYSWTGPNAFTSSTQNPSIINATTAASGIYSVTATVAGCTSLPATISSTVNAIPATPAASCNSPICEGSSLNLNATQVSGAAYLWTGPNSFSASTQNTTIPNATTAASGTYSVTATIAGCTSPAGTVTAVINPIPATPTASSNCPICAGSTLNLNASTVTGASYSWTGPNSFSSAQQNPSIANATTAAGGIYSVTATVAGCTSPAGTVAVTVNPIPATPAASSNSPVCQGNTLSLNATTVSGAAYSWTGPNSFSASTQNTTIANATTAASGTYSVTATIAGCTSPAGTVNVVVNPIPATPSASSNSPVCAGSTLSLNASTVTGAAYSWTGPNSFSSALQNPNIVNSTVAASGTYSVTATIAGCTSPAGIVSVTVNPIPPTPSASSNSPLCAGSTLNLNASTVTGAAYSWTGPNSFSSALQNPSVTNAGVAASGTYSVTATVAGCTSPAGTVNVIVNPIPATPSASSNSPVCQGSTLLLNAGNVPGATYSWSGPNAFSSSSQNTNIVNAQVAASGTYSVTATVAGCTSPAGTVNVTVNPIPATPVASSNSPVCAGNTLNLNATTVTGAAYAWTGPNTFTSTLQNPSIANAGVAASGTYSVTATIAGCTSPAGTVNVIVNPIPATPSASSNSPLCEGSTLNLNAGNVPGATYSWSGPNAFSSSSQNTNIINAQVAASGTYSVTATVAGCTSPAGTVSVIVYPVPATPSVTGNSPVCTGNTLSFSTAAVSGATYSWTGPNAFTSSVQNPSIPNVTMAANGTYSLAVTVNGCTSPQGTVTIVVNQTPTVTTATSNSPLCEGSTLNLSSNFISGATYSWTGPNGFTDTVQNPVIPNATLAMNGTYSVNLTTSGCTGATASTNVVVYAIPVTPPASNNSPICSGQTLNLYTNAVSNATYNWTGPNGFSSGAQNPSVNNAPVVAAGTYSLTVTVNGCTGPAETTAVVIDSLPSVNAGPDQVVCANNATVYLNAASTTGTGIWIASGGGTFTPSNTALNAAYYPDAADTAAGFVTLTFTSTNNGACNSASDQLLVTITDAPTVDAGDSQTVCANNAVVQLDGSFTISSGAQWSTSGSGFFSPSASAMNATYTPSAADTAAGVVVIYLTSAGYGNCVPVTDSLVITITDAPVLNAGNDTTVCINSPNILLHGTSNLGAGQWTTDGLGNFTNPNALNTTYIPSSADLSAGSVLIFLNTTDKTCMNIPDTLVAFFTPLPVADAGYDTTICANNSAAQLNGFSSTGSGTWTSSGNGTFFPDANTLNASYTPGTADTANGSATLTLTTTNNAGCSGAADQVIITITDAPVASIAGWPLQIACANNLFPLNGTVTGGGGTGIWSTPNGGGIFLPSDTALNAYYLPPNSDTAAGIVLLILTSTNNQGCFASSDTVGVIIKAGPEVNAGPDAYACSNNPDVVLNGSISIAPAAVWSSSGTGTFSPDSITLNATYIPGPGDVAAGAVTIYLTSTGNGTCAPAVDSMIITYTPSPVANAGPDQVICYGTDSVFLAGVVSGNSSSGQWSTSGDGVFSPNDTTLNAVYIPGTADSASGAITLYLTTTNNGNCFGQTDSMNIIITPLTIAMAGNDTTVCATATAIALHGQVSGPGSAYWTTSGNGIFSPNNTALNTTYIPGTGDAAAGTIFLLLNVSNSCQPVSDSIVVSFAPAPVVSAGQDIIICEGNSAALNGSAANATGVQWSTGGNGTFVPSSTAANAAYIPGQSDISAGSVMLYLTSTGTGYCAAVTDSVLITINPKPHADFTPGPGCVNETVSCTDQSTCTSGTIASWTWSSFAGTSSLQNTGFTFTSTGAQNISLVVVTAAGCSDTITRNVYINPAPQPDFALHFDCPTDISLTNNSSIASGTIVSWNWDFGDASTSNAQNPSYTYADTGVYIVALTLTSDSGCTALRTDTLVCIPCEEESDPPAVPSAFTPNGDGINDVLYVKGGPFTELEFRIYNEWGNLIFSSGSQNIGWDGTYKSKLQPQGRYVWTIACTTIDGSHYSTAGDITIIR
jgi:gliding motility-associated-like protein